MNKDFLKDLIFAYVMHESFIFTRNDPFACIEYTDNKDKIKLDFTTREFNSTRLVTIFDVSHTEEIISTFINASNNLNVPKFDFLAEYNMKYEDIHDVNDLDYYDVCTIFIPIKEIVNFLQQIDFEPDNSQIEEIIENSAGEQELFATLNAHLLDHQLPQKKENKRKKKI